MSSRIIGTILSALVILALALVPVVVPGKVAVAQSSPKPSFEIQPSTLVFQVCGSASPLVDVHTSSEVNMLVKYKIR